MADEGLMALFLTGQSQTIFGCVVDQDVTPENPRKLVPLEKIHKDFRDRAAVSDFHPCKAQMQVRAHKTCSLKTHFSGLNLACSRAAGVHGDRGAGGV